MAYNKKYAELGESVIDYVNNMNDAIEGVSSYQPISQLYGASSKNGMIKFPPNIVIFFGEKGSTIGDWKIDLPVTVDFLLYAGATLDHNSYGDIIPRRGRLENDKKTVTFSMFRSGGGAVDNSNFQGGTYLIIAKI